MLPIFNQAISAAKLNLCKKEQQNNINFNVNVITVSFPCLPAKIVCRLKMNKNSKKPVVSFEKTE